jgi:hypothetical protein
MLLPSEETAMYIDPYTRCIISLCSHINQETKRKEGNGKNVGCCITEDMVENVRVFLIFTTYRITGVSDFIHRPDFNNYKEVIEVSSF